MSDHQIQEPDFSQQEQNRGIDSTTLNLLAMLYLTADNHQSTTATAIATTAAPLFSSMDPQCSNFGSTTKRQSPSSLFTLQEPPSKRATLLSPSSPSTTAASTSFPGDHRILGFTKLPLTTTCSDGFTLRRTISDPINSPGAKDLSDQAEVPNSMANLLNPAATSPSQPLYRSISDPTSVSYPMTTTATATTSPRPPPAGNVMPSPSIGEVGQISKEESPSTKRLKRMKDRLREMSQWWNEVIKEDEEESGSEENDSPPKTQDDEYEVSRVAMEREEGHCEEAVWVERSEECLILHFKCPCGKGYQILLSGNNCYYKLTAF